MKPLLRTRRLLAAAVLGATVLLSSCATMHGERSRTVSSSVVEFLYPEGSPGEAPLEATPQLRLPVRVGLMFVPSRGGDGPDVEAPSEALKAELLERVRHAFRDRPYIGEIVIVPEPYLRQARSGGFRTLEQLGRLYGFEVAALVSYDQVATRVDSNWSVLYLTVVGAYVIPAQENQVSTFVDTSVFDLRTRKLLLRAPGLHHLERRSTAVEGDKVVLASREQGLRMAMNEMTMRLDTELGALQQRLREGQAPMTIVDAQGRAAGASGVMLLLGLVSAALLRCRRRNQVFTSRPATKVPTSWSL